MEMLMVYLHVKYGRVIINSGSAMDINANLHLTLTLETLEGQGQQGQLLTVLIKAYMHVQFERVMVNIVY